MNIKDNIHYKRIMRRANTFKFKNSNMFQGEYISDIDEAEQFIKWLKENSGYEYYEIVSELEHHIQATPCELCRSMLKLELDCLDVPCTNCGEILLYQQMHKVMEKTPISSSEKTIARSLTGATMAKEVRTTYSVNHFLLCPRCYRKHLLKKILKWVLIGVVVLAVVALLLS